MTDTNGTTAPARKNAPEMTRVDAITNHASGVLENTATAAVQQIDNFISELQGMRAELLDDVAKVRATIQSHVTLADQFGTSVTIIRESIDKMRADNAKLIAAARHES